jgi:hypothetical protein
VSAPPRGEDWVHEIKFDGYRLVAVAAYRQAELFTRAANDWSERFKPLCAAFAKFEALLPKGRHLEGVAKPPQGARGDGGLKFIGARQLRRGDLTRRPRAPAVSDEALKFLFVAGAFQNRHVLNPFLLFSRMKIGQRKWRTMQRSKKPRASPSTLVRANSRCSLEPKRSEVDFR